MTKSISTLKKRLVNSLNNRDYSNKELRAHVFLYKSANQAKIMCVYITSPAGSTCFCYQIMTVR